jgi:cytoskeletal protein RodZ
MDEIGHILREARENKGLSLEEAQAKTRISVRYLTALENGQYSALPTAVHVRGFLRNYARFLGLDPQPLLTRYAAGQGQDAPPPAAEPREITPDNPLVERQDQPFFDPVNMEVNGKSNYGVGSSSSGGMLQLVIIVALVIALALIANRFIPILFGRGGADNAVQEVSDAVRDAVADVTGATATPTPSPTPAPTGGSGVVVDGTEQPIISTGRNNPGGVPTTTPTRPPLPATLDEVRLKLEILERTWMEVTVDGSVVFSGIARVNDVYEWTAQQEAKVVTGNAIGIFATVNDVALGRLGGRGEQYEEVWRTTP